MLFSEPKISQLNSNPTQTRWTVQRFSALQRAENFSIVTDIIELLAGLGFSALQRAENFSIAVVRLR